MILLPRTVYITFSTNGRELKIIKKTGIDTKGRFLQALPLDQSLGNYKLLRNLYNRGLTETLIVLLKTDFETGTVLICCLFPFPKTWALDQNIKHKF